MLPGSDAEYREDEYMEECIGMGVGGGYFTVFFTAAGGLG